MRSPKKCGINPKEGIKEGKGRKRNGRNKQKTKQYNGRFKPNYINITLNVNVLNIPIKRQRLLERI